MRVVFFLFLFLGLMLVQALGDEPVFHFQHGIEVPPKAYDHVPLRPILTIVLPLAEVDTACTEDIGVHDLACARIDPVQVSALLYNRHLSKHYQQLIERSLIDSPTLCVMFIPAIDKDMSAVKQDAIIHHERAHCNGLLHDPVTGHGWYLNGKEVK